MQMDKGSINTVKTYLEQTFEMDYHQGRNNMSYPGVKEVKPLTDYKLLLRFENDEEKIFDMNPFLDKGIFKELKNVDVFNNVRVCFDTIEWGNGADLCPELLYRESKAA